MSFLSIAAPIVGGLLGAAGNKGSKETSTSKPYLPENYEEGYDKALTMANKMLDKPYSGPSMMRYTPSGDIFDSPVLAALQQYKDNTPATAPEPQKAGKQDEAVDMAKLALAKGFLMGPSSSRFSPSVLAQRALGGREMTPNIADLISKFASLSQGKQQMQSMGASPGSEYYKMMSGILGRA